MGPYLHGSIPTLDPYLHWVYAVTPSLHKLASPILEQAVWELSELLALLPPYVAAELHHVPSQP